MELLITNTETGEQTLSKLMTAEEGLAEMDRIMKATALAEYKALMTKAMTANVSPYIESECRAFDALCAKIDEIEAEYPDFADLAFAGR